MQGIQGPQGIQGVVNASASPSFNELHRATTDGFFVFGRNDQVISVPAVTTSNPFFSGVIGQAALAHMYGAIAHSSLQRVNRGDSQYVRVNLKELYIGNDVELRLGDGVKSTLPYTNGSAIVKVQFVGSGAGANVIAGKLDQPTRSPIWSLMTTMS